MIKFLTKILSIAIISFTLSCTSFQLSKEKYKEITNNEHGFIQIDFNYELPELLKKNHKNIIWFCNITVNNEKYFSGTFSSSETYKFPIPAGENLIKYELFTARNIREPVFEDGYYWYFSSEEKTIKLFVKNTEDYSLKIKNIGDTDWKILLFPSGQLVTIPWFYKYKKVELTLEK
jgi:hypothetical protein